MSSANSLTWDLIPSGRGGEGRGGEGRGGEGGTTESDNLFQSMTFRDL